MASNTIEMAEAAQGLSSAEAAARLVQYGPNQLKPRRQAVLWQFLARFRNPLVLILLMASILSAATGDATSATVIAVMVLMSVILDFVQEYRAGLAAENLARQVALCVRVVRDAREQKMLNLQLDAELMMDVQLTQRLLLNIPSYDGKAGLDTYVISSRQPLLKGGF